MSTPVKKKLRLSQSTSLDKSPIKRNENVNVGNCPSCQVPLSVLGCQMISWHLSECVDVERRNQLECSMGEDCDSTITSHYMKCTHYRLAARRSGVEVESVDTRQPFQQQLAFHMQHSKPPEIRVSARSNFSKQAKITSFFTNATSSAKSREDLRVSITTENVPKSSSSVCRKNDNSLSLLTAKRSSAVELAPSRRSCPKYKKLVDAPFVVDAFRYGDIPLITAYFLSHFHSDHYAGLTNKFRKKLYCSQITANLVKLQYGGIPTDCIFALPMDEPCVVNDVEVTLIEANHCPGAVMFLFRYTDGRTVLHTGDFRADATMEQHPAFRSPLTIDYLYLDTTYCQPLYDFPTQREVIDFVVKTSVAHTAKETNTLIVCGSYTIGKEKVFTAIAQALRLKVWASKSKKRILKCLHDADINNMITDDIAQARIHVLAMSELNCQYLEEYLTKSSRRYDSVLAFRPTGWEHSRRGRKAEFIPKIHGRITIYGVPYSEHSSFTELRRFVQFVKPVTVIPTVNVTGDKSRQQMDIIRTWMRKSPFDSPKAFNFKK